MEPKSEFNMGGNSNYLSWI